MTQSDDQRAGAAFLPCPFCGGPPTPIVSEPSGMWHGLMCTHCPCKVHGFREWRDALNAWNTRSQPKPAGEAGGWEDAMRWCREEAARIADKFPEEVGPAIIEATINMRFPHDRKPPEPKTGDGVQ